MGPTGDEESPDFACNFLWSPITIHDRPVRILLCQLFVSKGHPVLEAVPDHFQSIWVLFPLLPPAHCHLSRDAEVEGKIRLAVVCGDGCHLGNELEI